MAIEIPKEIVDRPIRIQRSRARGWKMPQNTVYVGRPTIFGNISTCTRPHNCALRPCECCDDATDGRNWCCVLAFREYVVSGIEGRSSRTGLFRYACDAVAGYPIRAELVRRLPELRGKNLACWCALDVPCHADVLLELVNADRIRETPTAAEDCKATQERIAP